MANNPNRVETRMSNQILPNSSNLMGICFLIFSFVKTTGKSEATMLDDLAAGGVFIFLTSSILSYFSLRFENQKLEQSADVIFIVGLLLLAVTTSISIFEVIH
jgi:hypothetical protein